MIDWTQTNHVWSVERTLQIASISTVQEGMALVTVLENNIMKVKASAGSTSGVGAHFDGIAMGPRRLTTWTKVVQVTVPVGGGSVLLANTTTNLTTIGATNNVTNALVAVTTSAASPTNIQAYTDATTGLTGLTFDATGAGNAGGIFNVTYSYTPSNVEALALVGNPSPGYYNSDQLAQISVFKLGRISVNNYDPQANWAIGDGLVKIATGGLFTSSDGGGGALAGVVPVNVIVIGTPTSSYPWLQLEIG